MKPNRLKAIRQSLLTREVVERMVHDLFWYSLFTLTQPICGLAKDAFHAQRQQTHVVYALTSSIRCDPQSAKKEDNTEQHFEILMISRLVFSLFSFSRSYVASFSPTFPDHIVTHHRELCIEQDVFSTLLWQWNCSSLLTPLHCRSSINESWGQQQLTD